jgi:hypothetical protein
MPLYYFHISNAEIILDDYGTELPDMAAARIEALRASRELAFTGEPRFWAGERWKIWVTDQPNAAGPTLLTVEVSGSVLAA